MWPAAGEHNADSEDIDSTVLEHPCLQPNKVEDRLYLSSAYTEAAPVEVLQRHGITHILQVGYELQPHHPGVFAYCSVQIADRFDQDIVQCLPEAFQFIGKGMQDGTVLVHCVHGQSRSASVVIAYLMWRDGKPYADCLAAVKACRPRVNPNKGFEMQLNLLQDLGFDRPWPGWHADTFIAIRQQQLAQQQQGGARSEQATPALNHLHQQQQHQQHQHQQQQHLQLGACCQQQQQQVQDVLPAGQHQHLQHVLPPEQQPRYQQDHVQQHQQRQHQQHTAAARPTREAACAAAAGDSEHQDLVVLASSMSPQPHTCSSMACSCSKMCMCADTSTLATEISSDETMLRVDVDVELHKRSRKQQQQQQHRRTQPVCCAVM